MPPRRRTPSNRRWLDLAILLLLAVGHCDCLCAGLPDCHDHGCQPLDHLDHRHGAPCEAHCGGFDCQALTSRGAAVDAPVALLLAAPVAPGRGEISRLVVPLVRGGPGRTTPPHRGRAPPHSGPADC